MSDPALTLFVFPQIRYNDVSPMEHHHLSASFTLLQDPTLDFLEGMSGKSRASFRKQVIEAVLATDMKQHFSLVSLFNTKSLPRRRPLLQLRVAARAALLVGQRGPGA